MLVYSTASRLLKFNIALEFQVLGSKFEWDVDHANLPRSSLTRQSVNRHRDGGIPAIRTIPFLFAAVRSPRRTQFRCYQRPNLVSSSFANSGHLRSPVESPCCGNKVLYPNGMYGFLIGELAGSLSTAINDVFCFTNGICGLCFTKCFMTSQRGMLWLRRRGQSENQLNRDSVREICNEREPSRFALLPASSNRQIVLSN